MQRFTGLMATICLLAGCAGSGKTTGGEHSEHAIRVGDLDRSFLLYTPAGASRNPAPLPLVLVFHGGGGTAQRMVREVGPSLHRIADREGFYVAYPHAVDGTWDFGAGPVSEALEVRIDDRAYFGALLDELTTTLPIDEARVFATGASRGGMASYFVACALPQRIRAIAPVIMPMPTFMLDICADVTGIGVAVFNGTKDPLVPYDGGQITVGRRGRDSVMSTDDTLDFWLSRNRCRKDHPTSVVIDTANDRMRVIKTGWDDCALNPVLLYRIEGGGHTWPNGSQYLPRFLIGRVNRDIDGATEVWSFFDRFR